MLMKVSWSPQIISGASQACRTNAGLFCSGEDGPLKKALTVKLEIEHVGPLTLETFRSRWLWSLRRRSMMMTHTDVTQKTPGRLPGEQPLELYHAEIILKWWIVVFGMSLTHKIKPQRPSSLEEEAKFSVFQQQKHISSGYSRVHLSSDLYVYRERRNGRRFISRGAKNCNMKTCPTLKHFHVGSAWTDK